MKLLLEVVGSCHESLSLGLVFNSLLVDVNNILMIVIDSHNEVLWLSLIWSHAFD